jgi:hypothetical protein
MLSIDMFEAIINWFSTNWCARFSISEIFLTHFLVFLMTSSFSFLMTAFPHLMMTAFPHLMMTSSEE